VLRSGFQDQYYHRAQKIRTMVRKDLNEVFGRIDCLMTPVSPVPPFLHGESGLDSFQQKLADKFTATANFAGIPALAVPFDVYDGLPVGMQLIGPQFSEQRLFNLAKKMEQAYPPAACPFALDWEG
jgi:aspartyl-tRNA(Asn)/glutamyl-tRNA(Gln) amidotransferase subunit A